MLEIIGIIFIIFVVMRLIDKGIEETEEKEKLLKVQQQELRKEILLLEQELNKESKE